MTFSIVAKDPQTKEIGIAVHSKAFAVGTLCRFASVSGAVATQSLVNVSLGPVGLKLMSEGRSPLQVLEHFKIADPGIEYRQLGLLTADGESLSFTGEKCLSWAGGVSGENYAIQGNILAGKQVIAEMERAFLNTNGTLAQRLMAVLQAGDSAGGDSRGKQSAAILIAKKDAGRGGYGDFKYDLRVDDHVNPIEELLRLVNMYEFQLAVGELGTDINEEPERIDELITLIESYQGVKDEAWLTLATIQFRLNQLDEAKESLKRCVAEVPGMKALIKQSAKFGMFSNDFVEDFISNLKS